MPVSLHSARQCSNRLLDLLPDEELYSFARQCEMVDIAFKQVLAERGKPLHYVYFPCTAVFSVVASMQDGGTVEVGAIGHEGFMAVDPLLGSEVATETALCQISGQCLRISIDAFRREIDANAPLRRIAQRYLLAYLGLVSQSVACNRLHGIEERFARWILMTQDRVRSDEFSLTQEFISQMLGVHRPTVSLVAGAFQRAGMIRYRRGHITVLDRGALEDATCECYAAIEHQFMQIDQRRDSQSP